MVAKVDAMTINDIVAKTNRSKMECGEEDGHLPCINFCWGVKNRKEKVMGRKR